MLHCQTDGLTIYVLITNHKNNRKEDSLKKIYFKKVVKVSNLTGKAYTSTLYTIKSALEVKFIDQMPCL